MPASIVLALALIGVSFAGPLVRLSHAHPLAIAIWRLGFALVIIAVALVTTGSWRQWKRLDRAGMLIAIGAGVMLALHFWAWNSSVSMTSVSASVVLVNMQPALVALLSALVCGGIYALAFLLPAVRIWRAPPKSMVVRTCRGSGRAICKAAAC